MTTALLVIDCQVDFGSPDGEMARQGKDMTAPQAAVKMCEQLVAAARAAKVKVVFVGLTSRPGEHNLCVEATPGAAFIGPKPQAGDIVVSKTRYSAFARTGLGEVLRERGIDTVVLSGLTTECCVASSAWSAFEEGFAVVIVPDACAAYDTDLHTGALKALELSGAALSPSASLTAIWNKSL